MLGDPLLDRCQRRVGLGGILLFGEDCSEMVTQRAREELTQPAGEQRRSAVQPMCLRWQEWVGMGRDIEVVCQCGCD